MALSNEFSGLDATAQAEMVSRGEVTPGELVEAAIARIEDVNPRLNAVVTEMYDYARNVALGQLPEGPFRGVPFLVKDFLGEVAGFRFTESSMFLESFVPEEDSELVKRFKRAGLVFVGKTNLPEMAIGATTEPRLHGSTRNPWDTSRTPGGSSGGAAAAVASGMVPMAHGNDAGGSIRGPAACCGLFGLKPTRARNPLAPHYGDMFGGLVAEHALTRSVRDSATLLDATSGPASGDPYPAPPVDRPFALEVNTDPGQLKVAFTTKNPLGGELCEDAVACVRDAADLCVELGHEVVEAAPSFDAELMFQSFSEIMASGVAWGVEDWGRRTGREPTSEGFEPFIWALVDKGRSLTAPGYLIALQNIQRLSREIAPFYDDHDLWLTPTLGEPPLPLGTLKHIEGADPFELRRRQASFVPYTYISNATGQPSMSVPLYWNSDGLPMGAHFTARFGGEATLFRLAGQMERARPWAERRPDVWALR